MEMSQVDKPSFGDGFSAIFRIFTSPSTVYPQIRDGLSVWPGLIVIIILASIVGVMMTPYEDEASLMMVTSMSERGMVPKSAIEEQVAKGATPIWLSLLKAGGGTAIMVVGVSFFYWLILLIFFGGPKYLQTLKLVIYVSFIGVLSRFINWLYLKFADPEITSMKDMMLDLSPAVLFGDGTSFLGIFVSMAFNVFTIWSTILTVLGFSIILGRPWQKIIIPVLIISILGLILSTVVMWFAMGQVGG